MANSITRRHDLSLEDKLRKKIISIIRAFNFRGNIENLVEFYGNAVRIFIKNWQVSPDVTTEDGRMEPPLLLPIPPKNDCEIKKEETKDEPIEPPF
ncbi:hypothetical protein PENTCL1PPCAC_23583, partial [Pristionchus entomophagus]